MTRRLTKLMLVAGALMLGACSGDADVFAPEANKVKIDVRYDVQVEAQPPVQPAETGRRNRYAMAAS